LRLRTGKWLPLDCHGPDIVRAVEERHSDLPIPREAAGIVRNHVQDVIRAESLGHKVLVVEPILVTDEPRSGPGRFCNLREDSG